MKKYQHSTHNELETFLTRNGQVQRNPELFNDIRDETGNIVDPKNVKRTNELTGAGIEYMTSGIEYLCTHFRENIIDEPQLLYYQTPTIKWDAWIDIVTGGITGQRKRAEIAIMHLHAKPKPILITAQDGHRWSMQPFVIAFDWGKKEELNAKLAANLARLKCNKKELLPIDTITVQFSRPLFSDFFRSGAGTYSFPCGMYAKMFNRMNGFKKNIIKEQPEDARDVKDADSDIYLSAYARFARYIILHNNFSAEQLKNRHKNPCRTTLKINPIELAEAVYPSALRKSRTGERIIDDSKFEKFFTTAFCLFNLIEGFQFYPAVEGVTIDRKFVIGLYTNQDEAMAATEAFNKR
jgi:hypothetical protein